MIKVVLKSDFNPYKITLKPALKALESYENSVI